MLPDEIRRFAESHSRSHNGAAHYHTLVIGCGISGLSAAAILASEGKRVLAIDQNWLPGGCASSYPRKGWIFESGATTLLGLDAGMPLDLLHKKTGIRFRAWDLDLPMLVHMPDGACIRRHARAEDWIREAEQHFGPEGQREFWMHALRTARKVWGITSRSLPFPPQNMADLPALLRQARPGDLGLLPGAFQSVLGQLKKHGLHTNQRFREFVDAQLIISAQNTAEQVNWLFGATALCYTLFGNYYSPGGMLSLSQQLVEYIEQKGGEVLLRRNALRIEKLTEGYRIITDKESFTADHIISSLPLNNTLQLYPEAKPVLKNKILPAEKLWSAFQLGIVFRRRRTFEALHHQILCGPVTGTPATSYFVSLSHPDDTERCQANQCVASVSLHLRASQVPDKAALETWLLQDLERRGFWDAADILYTHSSAQKAWEKWTGRFAGFVGGYPQYLNIRPWHMMGSVLEREGFFLCGDSVFPGQGIPGVCLSGMRAAEAVLKANH